MSEKQVVFEWELRMQNEIHAIAKRSYKQCEREFINSLALTTDSETIDVKQKVALLMYELCQISVNKIAAIKRRLEEADEEVGVFFPRD